MVEAFFWGAFAASFLLLGAMAVYWWAPGRRVIAVVMALGTGLLIGSISFDLIDEALETRTVGWVGLLVLVGAATFTGGDWLLTRRGPRKLQEPKDGTEEDTPLAIVLGSVLDGIPESFVLGLTVLQGGVSLPLLAGVSLSNLPEGMASTSGLRASGWPRRRVVLMWTVVALAAAFSAALGYVLLDPATGRTGALAQAFAAGALLAMLTTALLPQAYAVEGILTGPLVVVGFASSLMIAAI